MFALLSLGREHVLPQINNPPALSSFASDSVAYTITSYDRLTSIFIFFLIRIPRNEGKKNVQTP